MMTFVLFFSFLFLVFCDNEWKWIYGVDEKMKCQLVGRNCDYSCIEDNIEWPGDRVDYSSWQVGKDFYIFGGYSKKEGGISQDMWKFDIENEVWEYLDVGVLCPFGSIVEVKGPSFVFGSTYIPGGRIHAASIYYEDTLAIYGGYNEDDFFGDIWIYNTTLRQWAYVIGNNAVEGQYPSTLTLMQEYDASTYYPTSRLGSATWSLGSTFWIFSGVGERNTPTYFMDFWRFNFETVTWSVWNYAETASYQDEVYYEMLGTISNRLCYKAIDGDAEYPCPRQDASTWVYENQGTSYLYMFGGVQYAYYPDVCTTTTLCDIDNYISDESCYEDAPYDLPVYYNQLWKFTVGSTTDAWSFLGGDIPRANAFSVFEIESNSITQKSDYAYGEATEVWPGGLAAAITVPGDGFVFFYGGVGYGKDPITVDPIKVQYSRVSLGQYPCRMRYHKHTPCAEAYNETCRALNDIWLFDMSDEKFCYGGGDLDPFADKNVAFGENHVDQGNWSDTAFPYGTAYGGGFTYDGNFGFYGGGVRFLNPVGAYYSSDVWMVNYYTCNGIPWVSPEVCNGRGTCLEGQNKCSCWPTITGDFCDGSSDLFACDDILETNEDVCSGHGDCIAEDVCDCFKDYGGSYCSVCVNCTTEDDGSSMGIVLGLGIGGGVVATVVILSCCVLALVLLIAAGVAAAFIMFGPWGYTLLASVGLDPEELEKEFAEQEMEAMEEESDEDYESDDSSN